MIHPGWRRESDCMHIISALEKRTAAKRGFFSAHMAKTNTTMNHAAGCDIGPNYTLYMPHAVGHRSASVNLNLVWRFYSNF